jgi:hypothetical protein
MMFDMVSAGHLSATHMVEFFDDWTACWHVDPAVSASATPLHQAIETLHHANFDLWHQEDKTRDPHAEDAVIAAAKRTIDRVNQLRNDQVERCDALLLEELAVQNLPNPNAELHSETPGLMLDRLSILSLKCYHTVEELERADAPDGHRERNRERLAILETQRNDLAASLDRLWQRVLRGELRFQLYRQLKMYNDPDLNPKIYRSSVQ